MKLCVHYLKKYKYLFFIAVFSVAMEALCDLLGPTLMSRVVNEGIENRSLGAVYHWGGIMILVTLSGAVFAVTRSILASRVSQSFGADLRLDLFSAILRFKQSSVDKIDSGSLITRMTNDVTQMTQFINGTMRIFFKAPLTCIGSIILASMLNLRLAVIIYAVVGIVTLLLYTSMRLSYPRFGRLQQAMDKLNSTIEEYLMGVRLIKAFGTHDDELMKFTQRNDDLYKKGVNAQIIITLISPILTLVVGLGSVCALIFGARLFSLNLTRPGQISAFIVYLSQILSSLLMITNIFNTFVRTKASLARINEIFKCESDFKASGSDAQLGGSIEFKDVTFSYPRGSGVPAIHNLSFKLSPGETLAVIGSTGSGKTTIAHLLIRLYDADSGSILLDGIDIKERSVSAVRDNIALVPQKATLFSGTVVGNITWGKKYASEDELSDVIKAAAAEFIYDMEDGIYSELGSGGVNISGGQKQRISIARALIKNSPVLVLDDATGALDTITESRVNNNLLKRKCTVIIITQRVSTARLADKILVLSDGEKVGFGNHDELLKGCSTYREIYNSQLGNSDAQDKEGQQYGKGAGKS